MQIPLLHLEPDDSISLRMQSNCYSERDVPFAFLFDPFRGFIQERAAQSICGREIASAFLHSGFVERQQRS